MRFLLFISLVLVVGCSKKIRQGKSVSVSDAECFLKAAPAFTTVLYDAGIDVVGNHFSGLLLVKTMPDSSQRVVFTNEAGITFLDFQWNKGGEFKPLHCIAKLNKKMVINTLRKDFELLLIPATIKENMIKRDLKNFVAVREKETLNIKIGYACQSIISIEVMGKKSKLVDVWFSPEGKNVPDSVYIGHHNFNMNMILKRIEL